MPLRTLLSGLQEEKYEDIRKSETIAKYLTYRTTITGTGDLLTQYLVQV